MARRPKNRTNPRAADPYREREAKQYENPIPSREYILGILEEEGAPLGFNEILDQLELEAEDERIALQRRLSAMERDGQVVRNRRGSFCLVNKKDLVAGRIIAHPDGFGFLKPDEDGNDLFMAPKQMRMVMHGDRAVARITGVDRRGRREGAIVEVLERANRTLVGHLYIESGVGFLVPDNKRLTQELVIPESAFGGAKPGQIVVAEIVEQPTRRTQAVGKVIEVLGDQMAPGMEVDIAVRSFDLPQEWPQAVLDEVAGLAPEVEESQKAGRKDLRKLPLVTIDGADAKDFDDAVYCEPTPKGWKLYVAIADVSAYVRPGTALDQEGWKRGNSVYFPDRVIPMLPEILSNGLCSLNPKVDRLCMVAEVYVTAEGKVMRSRFFEGVMHSHARLTYEKAAAIVVEQDPALRQEYAEVVAPLEELYRLFKALQKGRAERGAIDFDTTETVIRFNADKKVDRIEPVQRNDAHRLIEECMLAANVAAARTLLRKKTPALYRIHEGPQEERLDSLRQFLGEVGLSLPGSKKPKAEDYAKLLEQIKGRPDFHLIQTVMLRSLSQAVYSSKNVGHFGLSFPAYTHFTSPIRRYPDLVVHRALKYQLTGGEPEGFEYSPSQLQTIGEHCSATERRADEATRDVEDWLKCEFMMDKVGEEFDGIISSVNSFGLFVELQGIYIDGLVHISALDNDYYHFEPVGHRLSGERSGTVYRLGDPLRVKVAAVNLDDRKIDFVLAESGEGQQRPAKKRGARRSRKPKT